MEHACTRGGTEVAGNGHMGVDSSGGSGGGADLIGLLVAEVQSLTEELRARAAEVDSLKRRAADLEGRLRRSPDNSS